MQSPDDLLDLRAVCALIGGTRPINPATLYRNVRKGLYPRPLKIGPNSSRWLRVEVEAALARMVEARR
jgi:predicted DNA-binding transcriptional regulator AlpA